MRNILFLQDEKRYVVFLIPKENKKVAKQALQTKDWVKDNMKKHVSVLYWEAVVPAVWKSVQVSLQKYYVEFNEKYLGLYKRLSVQKSILSNTTKNMNAKDLKKWQKDFEEEIVTTANMMSERIIYANTQNREGIIFDGVGDIDAYLNPNSLKIMWILKEPWDIEKDNSFRIYDYNITQNEKLSDTIRNMTFFMECFLIDGMTYEQLPSLSTTPAKFKETKERVKKALGQIAYINISKVLGENNTNHERLQELWNKWNSVIKVQIENYKPDVIIFGGTFCVFEGISEIDSAHLVNVIGEGDLVKVHETTMYSKPVTLIETDHPSYSNRLGERTTLIAKILKECRMRKANRKNML